MPRRPRLNAPAIPDFGVPSKEALEYFRAKGIKPGFSYLDVWREEHVASFTAAKLMEEDILEAVRDSLNDALTRGIPFKQWARDIDATFRKSGWEAYGTEENRPYRLERIFETNMRVARAAGQWERIQQTSKFAPYLMYQLGASEHHRPEHVAWHGLILRADDAFWRTHYPPNGWGCKCHVIQLTEFQAQAQGGADMQAPPIEFVNWVNPKTKQVLAVPKGIDPGWDYNPGMERLKGLGRPPTPTLPPNIGGSRPTRVRKPKEEPEAVPETPLETPPTEEREVPAIKGVPEGYYSHPAAPDGRRFDERRLLEALEKSDPESQAAARRELNNLMAERGLVAKDIIESLKAKTKVAGLADEVEKWKKLEDEARAKMLDLAKKSPEEQASLWEFLDNQKLLASRMYDAAVRAWTLAKESIPGPSQIGEEKDLADCAGVHLWGGKIVIDSKVAEGARRALAMPESASNDDRKDLETYIHETVHGHSPLAPSAYKKLGAKLEEATTEIAAHAIATDLFGVERGSFRRAYALLCEAVEDALRELKFKKPAEAAVEASLAFRRGTTTIDNPSAYIDAFVLALPGVAKKVNKATREEVDRFDRKVAEARAALEAKEERTVRGGGGGYNLTEILRGPEPDKALEGIRRDVERDSRHAAIREYSRVIETHLGKAPAYTKAMERVGMTLDELDAAIDELEPGDLAAHIRLALEARRLGVLANYGQRLAMSVSTTEENFRRYLDALKSDEKPAD